MLYTCKSTETPPKPNKKEVNIRFKDIFLHAILEILFMPVVISSIPEKREPIKDVGILKKLNVGVKIYSIKVVIPLAFNIEIIDENITTKPTNY